MAKPLDRKVISLLLAFSAISVVLCQALLIITMGLKPSLLGGVVVSNTPAYASLTIISRTSISFTATDLDFGHGYINLSCNNCTMHCDGDGYSDTSCCYLGWSTPPSNGLLLKNNGNADVNLMLNVSKNASAFIGSGVINPEFQFRLVPEYIDNHTGSDNDDVNDSCAAGWLFTDWTDANTTAQYVCGNETSFSFTRELSKNEVAVNVRVVVPRNAPRGSKEVLFTATATSP